MILFYDMGHYNVNGLFTCNQEPIKQHRHEYAFLLPLGPRLLMWINFNLSMEK